MQLETKTANLQRMLAIVSRVFGRGDHPLILRVDDGQLTMQASDGELSLATYSAVDGANGEVGVNPKLFADLIKNLPSKADVKIYKEGSILHIEAGDVEVELRTLQDASIKPVAWPSSEAVTVSGAAFGSVAEQVEVAASRDESRPMLTGISIVAKNDQLTMVATDSYRLAVARSAIDGGDWEALLPAKTVNELRRLADDDSVISVERADDGFRASVGECAVNSRLIDGNFPPYEGLVPKEFSNEVSINTEELQAAVNRMSVLAGRTSPLRLEFETGKLTIGVEGGDLGRGKETIECDWTGDSLQIGYNPQYFSQGLNLVGETLHLKVVDAVKPSLLLRPDDENFLYLLMPTRLT